MFKAKDTAKKTFRKIVKKTDLRTKLPEVIRRVFKAEVRQSQHS